MDPPLLSVDSQPSVSLVLLVAQNCDSVQADAELQPSQFKAAPSFLTVSKQKTFPLMKDIFEQADIRVISLANYLVQSLRFC